MGVGSGSASSKMAARRPGESGISSSGLIVLVLWCITGVERLPAAWPGPKSGESSDSGLAGISLSAEYGCGSGFGSGRQAATSWCIATILDVLEAPAGGATGLSLATAGSVDANWELGFAAGGTERASGSYGLK